MKKRHNRLSAILLSMFMCISTITLPVYAQDAGTEPPIPEQEPETEVIVSEEEPAETEEEIEEAEPAGEEAAEDLAEDRPDEENPAELPEETEEEIPVEETEAESGSELYSDPEDGYYTIEYYPNLDNVTRVSRDLSQAGYEVRAFYPQNPVVINMDYIHPDYTLVGWALTPDEAANGVVTYTNGQDLGTYFAEHPQDLVLYGVWESNDEFVYISYYPMLDDATKINGTLSEAGHEVRAISWDEPAIINMEFIHSDYNFLGWAENAHAAESGIVKYHNGDNLSQYFELDRGSEVSLYAVWEPKEAEQYKVLYYPTIRGVMDGGYTLSANDCVVKEYGVDKDVIVNFNFIHQFKVFKGWALTKEDALNGIVKYQNGQNIGKYFAANKHSLELYAVWENDTAAKYVHYDPVADDAIDIGGQLSEAGWFTQRFNKNDEVIVNQECIRPGYVLKGWNTDKAKAEAGVIQHRNGDSLGKYFAKGAKDLILYAVWAPEESTRRSVKYYPVIDGVSLADGELDEKGYEEESFSGLDDVNIEMQFIHNDYTLEGWALSQESAERGEVEYRNGDVLSKYFTNHEEDLCLYAVWLAKDHEATFKVIYHSNKEEAIPAGRSLSSMDDTGNFIREYEADEKVVINLNMIHPTFVLQGWATSVEDANKGVVTYKNGEVLGTYFESHKKDLELYGVWKSGKTITKITVPTQTINLGWDNSYDDSTAYNVTPTSITVTAKGKTYKGAPYEVADKLESALGYRIPWSVENQYVHHEGDEPGTATATLVFGGVRKEYTCKFVKNPVDVTIDTLNVFESDVLPYRDSDDEVVYDFTPEMITVKIGKKTYKGDFQTVATKLNKEQKITMESAIARKWPADGEKVVIRLWSEKYSVRGKGYAEYEVPVNRVSDPFNNIEEDLTIAALPISSRGQNNYYFEYADGKKGTVDTQHLVDALKLTLKLKEGEPLTGSFAEINAKLRNMYGASIRNANAFQLGSGKGVLNIAGKSIDFDIVLSETVNEEVVKVAKGKSVTLSCTNIKPTKWESLDKDVLKVSSKGKVTGLKEGIGKIRATAKNNESELLFVEVYPAVQSVTVAYTGSDERYSYQAVQGKTITLDENETNLQAYLEPYNAIQGITWTSSNPNIAEIVSDDGSGAVKIKRNNNGLVTITAKANDGSGKKVSVKIKYVTYVSHLEIEGPTEVAAGKKVTLKATATGADDKVPTNKAVTWTSGDPAIVKVNSKGVVTGVKGKEGSTVYITATAKDGSGVSETFRITVSKPVTKLTLMHDGKDVSKKTFSNIKDDTFLLYALRAGNEKNKVKWTSSKPSVATVEDGVVTRVPGKIGTVKITAMATDGSGKKATVTLKFVNP